MLHIMVNDSSHFGPNVKPGQLLSVKCLHTGKGVHA